MLLQSNPCEQEQDTMPLMIFQPVTIPFISIVLVALTCYCTLSHNVVAQETAQSNAQAISSPLPSPLPRPYPTSALISAQTMSAGNRAILEQLFLPDIPAKALTARSKELCPHSISRLAPIDESAKKALATTDVSISPEILFEREGQAAGLELQQFSVIVEFSAARVFLQHTEPRFPSDASGFTVPMASESTRPVRLEGKFGADIFALVPPLRECGVQAVALCARRYTKNDELLQAPYAVTGLRPIVNAKADGVYAPPTGTSGKVMVSLLASQGIQLPQQWFTALRGTGTLSEHVQIATSRDARARQPVLPADNVPLQLAVESRVDFGREEGSVRTSSERSTIELSTIPITGLPAAEVGTSELSVQGGQCYLVTRWSSEVL
jgi:hypothetical protein